jgi:hypothetical protein
MRKLTFIAILGVLPALGCQDCLETARRVEIWKSQYLFAPKQPLVVSATSPCATPIAPSQPCGCPPGAVLGTPATMPAVTTPTMPTTSGMPILPGEPGSITVDYPAGAVPSAQSASTEELDGVLKQP